jgi:hypothetical protein
VRIGWREINRTDGGITLRNDDRYISDKRMGGGGRLNVVGEKENFVFAWNQIKVF